jgi:hypothetical protein
MPGVVALLGVGSVYLLWTTTATGLRAETRPDVTDWRSDRQRNSVAFESGESSVLRCRRVGRASVVDE